MVLRTCVSEHCRNSGETESVDDDPDAVVDPLSMSRAVVRTFCLTSSAPPSEVIQALHLANAGEELSDPWQLKKQVYQNGGGIV